MPYLTTGMFVPSLEDFDDHCDLSSSTVDTAKWHQLCQHREQAVETAELAPALDAMEFLLAPMAVTKRSKLNPDAMEFLPAPVAVNKRSKLDPDAAEFVPAYWAEPVWWSWWWVETEEVEEVTSPSLDPRADVFVPGVFQVSGSISSSDTNWSRASSPLNPEAPVFTQEPLEWPTI